MDHLLQENFSKESKSCSRLYDIENHRSVSNPPKTIVFNGTLQDFEESFLLDQSM